MNHYLVEVILTMRHRITVAANDEHEAQKLAELQKGERGQQSANEFAYKRPKLLGGMDGQ